MECVCITASPQHRPKQINTSGRGRGLMLRLSRWGGAYSLTSSAGGAIQDGFREFVHFNIFLEQVICAAYVSMATLERGEPANESKCCCVD